MASVKVVFDQLQRELIDAFSSTSTKNKLGKFVVNIIKTRTKAGVGVSNKSAEDLDELKTSTVKRRRTKSLASDTTPSTSNLTESGKMLNDVTYKVVSTGINITLKTPKSRKKAQYNEAGGRAFMDLTIEEEDDIAEFILNSIL